MSRKSSLTGAANANLNSSVFLSAEEFADQRQDEIVLDHAMAKSSNVGTPEEEAPSASTPPPPIKADDNIAGRPPQLPEELSAPVILEQRRDVTADIDDDFFSMNFTRVYQEPRKKKKKKKVPKDPKSNTPSFNSVVSSSSKDTSVTLHSPVKKTETIPEDANVIVLDDDAEPKKRKRRLTPPSFDEESFRKSVRAKALDKMSSTNYAHDPQFDDYEELEFAERLTRMKKMADSIMTPEPLTRSNTVNAENLDGEEKAPRGYKLHVTSFLPGSENIALDLNMTGNKKFAKVTNKILKHLLNSQVNAEEYAQCYRLENVQLLWREIRITEYMKPDTLNIEEPLDGNATVLELGLYTMEQVRIIENQRSIEKNIKMRKALEEEELDRVAMTQAAIALKEAEDDANYDEAYREIDQEIAARDAAKGASATPAGPDDEEDAEGYFKIGLKGMDNKKIVVRVNNETKMSKLVVYYLQQKGLPEGTKVRLVFDDEDIPLEQTVGDTELEEDFTVEVYVM